MKKILSLVLALLMTFSAASMIGAADTAIADEVTAAPEEDLSIYDEAIAFLVQYGILKGYEDGLPHPEKPIERYQMALFTARISTGWVDDETWKVHPKDAVWWVGTDATVAEEWYDREQDVTGFTDLEGTAAADYLGALSYAKQKGIIKGYSDTKYGPEDGIRYEDALTMLCRVLEWTNYEWPWGFIEKAVNLGLTKGMPASVAYTDYLNRGQVALLIYNALQAPCKEGGTLLSRYFNGNLAWQNIIITAVGRGRVTTADVEKFGNGDLGSEAIAFRTVNADGTLDKDNVYLVKNSDSFGWAKHYERYLGYAFKAMFTVDDSGNYATIFNVIPLWENEYKNEGRLKKDAETGKYPIAAFLDTVSIKADGKFTVGNGGYLNTFAAKYDPLAGSKPEFILKNALQTVGGFTEVGKQYGILWTPENPDIVSYTKNADGEYEYTVEWYYNSVLKTYFKVLIDAKDEKVIGVDILDQDDIEKLIGSKISKSYVGGLAVLNGDVNKNTAYASLNTFKILGSPVENYGLFEEYGLGQFATGTAKDKDDVEQVTYGVNALNSIAKFYWEEFQPEAEAYLNKAVAQKFTAGNTDDHHIWISEDGLEPKNGDYIIYSFDEATYELKVVKIIREGEPTEHDYVGYGVVRGYKIADKKVVIGDKTYEFDYSELKGNGLLLKDYGKTEQRVAFNNFFKTLFNQYVKFLVVDDKLVYIERSGAKAAEFIVVDSYAGLSSDGYIVVNGYSTADLKYAKFKIGSYNGWVKGDYFYYPNNAAVDQAFARGTIYKITSTDTKSGTDPIYFVYTVAQADEGYYDVEADDIAGADWSVAIKNGYKQFNGTGDWTKAKSDDKYIFILNPETFGAYAPIIVYTGKGMDGWAASGYRVSGTADNVWLILNAYITEGFNKDQYEISYVLFWRYAEDEAAYDGTFQDDWYLLGASNYKAYVLDLYTGEQKFVDAVNKDLKKGYVYPCINDIVVDDYVQSYGKTGYTAPQLNPNDAFDLGDMNGVIKSAYQSKAKYVYGAAYVGDLKDDDVKYLYDAKEFSKQILSYNKDLNSKSDLEGWIIDLTENGTTVILVEAADNGAFKSWYKYDAKTLAAKLEGLDPDTVMFWYILNKKTGKTVIYVAVDGIKPAETAEDDIAAAKNLIVNSAAENDDDTALVKSTATFDTSYTYDADNKKHLVGAALKSVTFYWDDNKADTHKSDAISGENHEAIFADHFDFGDVGLCFTENWNTKVKVEDPYIRVNGSIAGTSYGEAAAIDKVKHGDDGPCSMLWSVEIEMPDDIAAIDLFPVAYETVADEDGNEVPKTDEDGNIVYKTSASKTTQITISFTDADYVDGAKATEDYEFVVEVTIEAKFDAEGNVTDSTIEYTFVSGTVGACGAATLEA